MNEIFASDPTCFNSALELKLILSSFGYETGRYHTLCPKEWMKKVDGVISGWSDLERKRAMEVIMLAKGQKGAFVEGEKIIWNYNLDWSKNVEKIISSQPWLIDFIITNDDSLTLDNDKILTPHDFPLHATEESSLDTAPKSFAESCEQLLLNEVELVFIDPYIGNFKDDTVNILKAMLKLASKGKCEYVKIFTRKSVPIHKVKKILNEIKIDSRCTNVKFKYYIFNDEKIDRQHARYLLTLRGGVRFDQGFCKPATGSKMDIGPIGRNILPDLIKRFIEDKYEFDVVNIINI